MEANKKELEDMLKQGEEEEAVVGEKRKIPLSVALFGKKNYNKEEEKDSDDDDDKPIKPATEWQTTSKKKHQKMFQTDKQFNLLWEDMLMRLHTYQTNELHKLRLSANTGAMTFTWNYSHDALHLPMQVVMDIKISSIQKTKKN